MMSAYLQLSNKCNILVLALSTLILPIIVSHSYKHTELEYYVHKEHEDHTEDRVDWSLRLESRVSEVLRVNSTTIVSTKEGRIYFISDESSKIDNIIELDRGVQDLSLSGDRLYISTFDGLYSYVDGVRTIDRGTHGKLISTQKGVCSVKTTSEGERGPDGEYKNVMYNILVCVKDGELLSTMKYKMFPRPIYSTHEGDIILFKQNTLSRITIRGVKKWSKKFDFKVEKIEVYKGVAALISEEDGVRFIKLREGKLLNEASYSSEYEDFNLSNKDVSDTDKMFFLLSTGNSGSKVATLHRQSVNGPSYKRLTIFDIESREKTNSVQFDESFIVDGVGGDAESLSINKNYTLISGMSNSYIVKFDTPSELSKVQFPKSRIFGSRCAISFSNSPDIAEVWRIDDKKKMWRFETSGRDIQFYKKISGHTFISSYDIKISPKIALGKEKNKYTLYKMSNKYEECK